MLDRLRTHVKGWLGMAILVLISIPFALFGLQNYTAGGSEAPVAEVGDYKIYQADVNNAYQERVAQLKQQYGDQYTADLFNESAIRNEALNRLVQERLISYTVNKDGYIASEQEILEVISGLDVFQKAGQFDKQTYTQLLRAKGLTTQAFVQQVKSGLERDQFISSIVDTTLVDDSEVDDFYRLSNQTRDLRYISLPISSVISGVQLTEEEVLESYQQNEHLYKSPQQASIDYVELNLADLMKEIEPTEEQLLSFYQAEKQSFSEVGRRRASHILFEVPDGASEQTIEQKRGLAESVLVKIRAGEDFASLAKKFSDDIGSAKTGGDLGVLTNGMLDNVLANAFDALNVGETSDVVNTNYGFQIIKLTEQQPAKVRAYDAVKTKVTELLKRQMASDKFYQMADRFAELSFEVPDSLQPLVDELGLSIKHQGLFSKGQGEGIAAHAKVRQATFSEDVLAGNNSATIELEAEHLAVLRVNTHKAEQVMPLEEVRSSVELALKTEKANRLLSDKASELLAKIESGAMFDDLKEGDNLNLVDLGPVTRNANSVPAVLLNDAFSMSRPSEDKPSYKKTTLGNGDVAIIELSKIVDGDLAEITEASRDSFKQFLARLNGEVTLAAALANLSVAADVVFANKAQ
ncbi:MAG: SurA N-terminal domain-containing protein [Cycloclasticus sp.]|nr:SurA N-terminal domain-containing protein [Cycloclasticus sp.]MBQ0789344.1 SurA N-terminal domain-containing protein [Cycloclasticus sp.]